MMTMMMTEFKVVGNTLVSVDCASAQLGDCPALQFQLVAQPSPQPESESQDLFLVFVTPILMPKCHM